MRKTYVGALVAALLSMPIAASAASSSAQCRTLQEQYRDDIDMVSRYMAVNAVGDDNLSALAEANASARSQIDLQAMRSAGCHTPAVVPSADKYDDIARFCAVKSTIAASPSDVPAHCDPRQWGLLHRR